MLRCCRGVQKIGPYKQNGRTNNNGSLFSKFIKTGFRFGLSINRDQPGFFGILFSKLELCSFMVIFTNNKHEKRIMLLP